MYKYLPNISLILVFSSHQVLLRILLFSVNRKIQTSEKETQTSDSKTSMQTVLSLDNFSKRGRIVLIKILSFSLSCVVINFYNYLKISELMNTNLLCELLLQRRWKKVRRRFCTNETVN